MKAKFSLIYIIILLFTAFYMPVQAFADTEPELTAEAYILMDMKTGQVLAEKNSHARRSPASTTKIMTAIIALENASLDTEMTASQNAINSVGYDYVAAGIKPGEIIKLQNLLELMRITSANEAGYIIAENISENGTVQGYADMMNQKARDLGLTGTHFTNPCGIEDPNHYTTAYDLAVMAREAMQYETFRDIVIKTDIVMPDTNFRKSNEWKAGHLEYTNKLLKYRSKYFSKVTGIKTGYTDPAGRCLVSSAVNPEDMELIAVVLGADVANSDLVFVESQKLLEYGFANFALQDVVKSGKYIDRVEVADAVESKKVELITDGDITHVLPISAERRNAELTEEKTLNEPFAAPIAQGQVLGKLEYFYKGESIGSVNIIAKESIEKTTIAQIRDKYYEIINDERFRLGLKITVGAIVFLIILRYVLKTISRRNKRKRRYDYSSNRKKHYRF